MVELLSPAGSKEAFLAALCGGADAIYVGGEKYGARAYAENFDAAALLWAIDKAHLYEKKLYLTVNTLMKQHELDGLGDWLLPLYEAGLDGVIVQDFGVLVKLRRLFPALPLHASTQMTVTGGGGAALLKEFGVTRIVPARELSLAQIRKIKQRTGLEIETFIHGAMCYSYSGQCLFSSMLGERSGNRGRCAGPCRLPYRAFCEGRQINDDRSLYQLSLKDLCSLEILPELIGAGIDSFKIEGRMKSKEYVSFVTGLYRYYIDAYLEEPARYQVSERDKKELGELFARGSLQSGYYFMHSGRALVTLEKPGYTSFAREAAPADTEPEKIPISGTFYAKADEPIRLTVTTCGGSDSEEGHSVTATGPVASPARSSAATEADVRRALQKTGNTDFTFETLQIEIDGQIFLPNKQLNELRRTALAALSEALLAPFRRQTDSGGAGETGARADTGSEARIDAGGMAQDAYARPQHVEARQEEMTFTVSLQTLKQLCALADNPRISRLILSFDCFEQLCGAAPMKKEEVRRILEEYRGRGVAVCLALPAVLREGGVAGLEKYKKEIEARQFDGFLINNLEGLAWARTHFPRLLLLSDHRFYLFQDEGLAFFERFGIREHFISYELHEKEIAALVLSAGAAGHTFCMPVYGHIPLMETAGCIAGTNNRCKKGDESELYLLDRQNKKIPVIRHCSRCENTLYNPVPLSLHRELDRVMRAGIYRLHLSFTVETGEQMNTVIGWYESLLGVWHDSARRKELTERAPFSQFTKGHLLKGVE